MIWIVLWCSSIEVRWQTDRYAMCLITKRFAMIRSRNVGKPYDVISIYKQKLCWNKSYLWKSKIVLFFDGRFSQNVHHVGLLFQFLLKIKEKLDWFRFSFIIRKQSSTKGRWGYFIHKVRSQILLSATTISSRKMFWQMQHVPVCNILSFVTIWLSLASHWYLFSL